MIMLLTVTLWIIGIMFIMASLKLSFNMSFYFFYVRSFSSFTYIAFPGPQYEGKPISFSQRCIRFLKHRLIVGLQGPDEFHLWIGPVKFSFGWEIKWDHWIKYNKGNDTLYYVRWYVQWLEKTTVGRLLAL